MFSQVTIVTDVWWPFTPKPSIVFPRNICLERANLLRQS